MKLHDFVEQFVCRNSIVRLWQEVDCGGVFGYQMIFKIDRTKPNDMDCVCMEWDITHGTHWLAEFGQFEVIGVKDIYIDDPYPESINIVIAVPEDFRPAFDI